MCRISNRILHMPLDLTFIALIDKRFEAKQRQGAHLLELLGPSRFLPAFALSVSAAVEFMARTSSPPLFWINVAAVAWLAAMAAAHNRLVYARWAADWSPALAEEVRARVMANRDQELWTRAILLIGSLLGLTGMLAGILVGGPDLTLSGYMLCAASATSLYASYARCALPYGDASPNAFLRKLPFPA